MAYTTGSFEFINSGNNKRASLDNSIGNSDKDVWVADMDWNGMADLMYRPKDSTSVHVLTSDGTSYSENYWGNLGSTNIGNAWQADMNADGKMDFIFMYNSGSNENDINVKLSEGNKFGNTKNWGTRTEKITSTDNQWVADFTGDGMSDFLYSSTNDSDKELILMKSNGSAFEEGITWATFRSFSKRVRS